ncbi:ATP-binding protein [Pseudoalteromonas luteoviolacea]|uniref:AAA+ ATPase domain-containing protein n=1 Tax=Pseudoalteromonas luteoviolacea (strain 2ta16) TaxID=1353533 RepID=V4I2U8_PSEL2|nr:ATP-binding protein [Pseudoalteromonas luteoviolacea]ESP94564.1 hypothetical protein PL2TA16_00564 [Pseudoalteromonas luteoviolacea 2ta16]KZN32259.1 hypothetical protein N483_03675 [Pseudoalteromonas luteoviolacea NCIMB 1944]
MDNLNRLVMHIAKRAERNNDDYLVKSFVHLDHIFSNLCLGENQLVYGRRGTGKTHLLKYLANHLSEENMCVIQLDLRLLGSTGGIFSESNIPVFERASRLFCDILCDIHEQLLSLVQNGNEEDLSFTKAIELLDQFIDLATKVTIEGESSLEKSKVNSDTLNNTYTAKLTSAPLFEMASSSGSTESVSTSDKSTFSGVERRKIHISSITKIIKEIVSLFPSKRLWILIDEWSEVPLDIQPYLADIFKRTLFGIPSVNVKIAAIEHRSNLRVIKEGVPIGIEVSSDAASSINLDEFMVFDNDKEKAIEFFSELVFKHCCALNPSVVTDKSTFLLDLFGSKIAVEEFVRASEGIPRDALYIISDAAMHSSDEKLKVTKIRDSARKWFQTNKSKDINSNEEALNMLDWIVNKVIGMRRSRGFLVRAEAKNTTLDFLYDSRILHLIKMGVSAKSHVGKRFNLYSLDYGCYADLLKTKDEPKGLIIDDNEYIEIPKIDFRSVKDAILDVNDYRKNTALPFLTSTDEIHLQAKFNGKVSKDLNLGNIELLKCLPSNISELKVKGTVYIPIIFIGLVIRDGMGFKESTGSEITTSYNENVQCSVKKKPNNISRALRENEVVMEEPWLVIKENFDGNKFGLSQDWKKYWNDYFATTDSFDF